MVTDPYMRDVIDVIIEEARSRFAARKQGASEEEADMRTLKDKVDDLNPRLYAYAKSKFPGMSDELIWKNSQDFLFHMEQGGMMDGHPLGLRLDKNTGDITLQVFIPQ